MKKLEIQEVALYYKDVERFERIKEHMEQCRKREATDKEVAEYLIGRGMVNYTFW